LTDHHAHTGPGCRQYGKKLPLAAGFLLAGERLLISWLIFEPTQFNDIAIGLLWQ
jgi:hypothetical protein